MTNPWRTRCRMAELVHARITRQPDHRTFFLLPEAGWSRLQRLKRQLHLAQSYQWNAARQEILQQLDRELDELQRHFTRLRQTVAEEQVASVVSEAEIARDLESLEEEFPETEFDLESEKIAVVTEQIELDGLVFGAFRIELSLTEIIEGDPYEVSAVDPQRANTNSDVTHPHVSANKLCEGDGRQAIRRALRNGRLLDFFVLVRQILNTYNSGSAYVRIEDWNGAPCHDCGVSVDPDESYRCEGCHNSYCSDCTTSSHGCDESHCSSCLTDCRDCDYGFCRGCLDACSTCHEPCCKGCLDVNDQCLACAEAATEEEETQEPEAKPEIHADGVGQAAVAEGCGTDGSGRVRHLPEP